MKASRRLGITGVVAGTLVWSALTGAQAAERDIRNLRGSEKQAFFTSVGWDMALKCMFVGVARSNERWAIASPTTKCGPNSGHSVVYKRNAQGKWKMKFYDMQNDGCDRFNVPASVRADFSPYVC